MKLDLLLASLDDDRPLLDGGLHVESTQGMERPGALPPSTPLRHDAADPNTLALQRWGVIAPEGSEGTRLLEAISPLIAARREAQRGRPLFVAQVRPDMNAEAANDWKRSVVDRLPVGEQPRYLLFLGDLDRVSLELQQALAPDTFAGRLAFARELHYEAYAAKVLEHERRVSKARRRVLLFAADDGTAATSCGYQELVRPVVEECRVQRDLGEGGLAAALVEETLRGGAEAASDLLARAATAEPTVLFTVSHGVAARRPEWGAEDRRALQGALRLGGGARITAADVHERPFLPGGIWFMFACYGAATPARSAYHHWLQRLSTLSGKAAADVLSALPQGDERPFVAALPRAALANPDGPLAVIGHADLAWTYAFADPGVGGSRHASRFYAIVRALVDGYRAGVAQHELSRFFAETSIELSRMYNDEERGAEWAVGPGREARKVHLWMRWNDLGSYLLLGDPAVTLPGA